MSTFPCFDSRHRSGITLIEVVASLMLMSSLLVGILLAFSRHQRQLDLVADRHRANTAINLLMYEWFDSDADFPVGDSGICPGDPGLMWTSVAVGQVQLTDELIAAKIRVNVFAVEHPDRALASIELVDRLPHDPANTTRRNR